MAMLLLGLLAALLVARHCDAARVMLNEVEDKTPAAEEVGAGKEEAPVEASEAKKGGDGGEESKAEEAEGKAENSSEMKSDGKSEEKSEEKTEEKSEEKGEEKSEEKSEEKGEEKARRSPRRRAALPLTCRSPLRPRS